MLESNDRHCVNRVCAVHRVLMNARCAKTLVVSSDGDPAEVDPVLDAWDSVVEPEALTSGVLSVITPTVFGV